MEKSITFGGNMVRQFNFAMQQNNVPIFRSLTLKNNTDSDLENITVRISFEPGFAETFTSDAICIKAGEIAEITPVNISVLTEQLLRTRKKTVGSVTIEAVRNEKIIASATNAIELLAADQWTGSAFMPEIIGAFVAPYGREIENIISKAALYLKEWCGDPSFTGYQKKSEAVVKMQMGAVYAALQEENIAHIMLPMNYDIPQKVRMPKVVIRKKIGTCLDLAVLYCSCLEYIGLNPILIFKKGSSLAGCWLVDDNFSDQLQYDCSAIARRTIKENQKISVVDCTDFTAGKTIGFDDSEIHGAEKLAAGEDFSYAVDIRKARISGVKALSADTMEKYLIKIPTEENNDISDRSGNGGAADISDSSETRTCGSLTEIVNSVVCHIYRGEPVLFLSEDSEVLEAVKKRLEKIGIAPFCLKLHSGKVRKRDVFEQFEATLRFCSSFVYDEAEDNEFQSRLSVLVSEILKVRSFGMSIYEAVAGYGKNPDHIGIFRFSGDAAAKADKNSYRLWSSEIAALAEAAIKFGDIKSDPLKICRLTECTADMRNDMREKLLEFRKALKTIGNDVRLISDISGCEKLSYRQYIVGIAILEKAACDGDIIKNMLLSDDCSSKYEAVCRVMEQGKEFELLRNELLKTFEISVFRYDCAEALKSWETAEKSWFIAKKSTKSKLVKELSSHGRDPELITKNNFKELCEKLIRLRELSGNLKNISPDIKSIFEGTDLLSGIKTKWERVKNAIDISAALRKELEDSPFSEAERKKIAENLVKYYGSTKKKAEFSEVTGEIVKNRNELICIISELSERFKCEITALEAENWQKSAAVQADRIINSLSRLSEWTNIMAICERIEKYGLTEIPEKLLDGKISVEELPAAADCEIHRCFITAAISEIPEFSDSKAKNDNDIINRFRCELEKLRSFAVIDLQRKLLSRIPMSAEENSQLEILKSTIKKGGRKTSVKKLFEAYSELIRLMYPVMLMDKASAELYIGESFDNIFHVINESEIPDDITDAAENGNTDLELLLDDCIELSIFKGEKIE